MKDAVTRVMAVMLAVCVPAGVCAQQPVGGSRPAANATPIVDDDSRRIGMAGIIDNSAVGTRLRVYFESGTGLTAADRAEYLTAKCGCYRALSPAALNYDANAPGPGPGQASRVDIQELRINGEFAITRRFSVFADLPYRSFTPQSTVPGTGSVANASGLGDLRGGAKLEVDTHAVTTTTLQVSFSAPTGDAAQGLGTKHWSVEPAMLYTARFGHLARVDTQVGAIFPLSGSAAVPIVSPDRFAGRLLYYAAGPSVDLYHHGNTRLAPVADLRYWRVIDGYSTTEQGNVGGLNIFDLTVGARLVVNGTHSVYLGYGKGISSAKWFDRTLRVEYRHGL